KGAIVLCHGLYGYDVKGPKNYPRLQTHYWPGIKESLEKMGNEVIITKVNEIGTIKERAYQLNEQLNKLCKDKQVNLIGHSMGGLDSRYLITHIQEKKYNVLSLTTISTPHRGSYLIDYFLKILNEMKSNTNNNNKSEQETMLSPAYFNLNCNYMKNYFNPNTPNNPNIKYYSYSTKVDTAPLSNPSLLFPYYVINKYEGINDGVVSVNSAKWGKHLDTINSSHLMVLDETDKNLFT
ncbi:alpha/beta-hydrolase, partial [Neoconidiobolus thromboides FSU 785]